MSKRYSDKTSRSRRKLQKLPDNAVQVDIADGQATFQMVLPMNAMLAEVASSIEQTASQAGLLMMKGMIDEEVEQLAGPRYDHDHHRQALRWGKQEGHVVFAGRKVAIERPRVTDKGGHEMALGRYEAFQDDRRIQKAVQACFASGLHAGL